MMRAPPWASQHYNQVKTDAWPKVTESNTFEVHM